MSVTLRDCLKLPSLSLGKVIAGHKGLDSIVATISVMEFDYGDEEDFTTPNELLISALYCVKDDVDAQCRLIKSCKKSGDIGLVLFYSDEVLNQVDPQIIKVADLINFPIILLPGHDMGLKYSDVVNDVMEMIFYDRKANNYFVSDTVKRMSEVPEIMRGPTLALKFACDYAKASFFLCDEHFNLIASSFWPTTNYADFDAAKSAFLMTNAEDSAMIETKGTLVFRTNFTEHNNNKLILYGVTHNKKLNLAIMSEVAEVIKLFTSLWNYNLNLSTKESVIPALLDGQTSLVEYICKRKGIERELYNRAMIVEATESSTDEEVYSLLNMLRRVFKDNGIPLIADLMGSHIVFLFQGGMQTKEQLFTEELETVLNRNSSVAIYTCYRLPYLFNEMSKLFEVYVTANCAVRKIFPYRKKFLEEDIHYGYKVLNKVNSLDSDKEYYMNLLQPVLDSEDPDLMKTLICYLLDGASGLKETAELLFVHRNTVLYRLNKLRDLLGFDLVKMPKAYDIYVAVSIYRLNQ